MAEKENHIRIPARSIHLLIDIKQNLMDDGDLSFRIAGCRKYAAASYIDDLIKSALDLERKYHELVHMYSAVKKENEEYNDLLEGFSPDILGDKEKEEIKALVEAWQQEDSM